ncbi:MAG: PIG-L family deacetylase [Anaerolineales bacterium]|nr:MAG: PIG-L family deacetylase [Anaerolineales bacterium]
MNFRNQQAEIYIPDGLDEKSALSRTTHLAIGAHQDDLEIMAIDGILQCFHHPNKWFTGVVVTDGSGSPRSGVYANYTDAQMMAVRMCEQKKAAEIGEYAAQLLLKYPSSAVKDGNNTDPVIDLTTCIQATQPQVIYTHNLADKHPTHVGVAVKVIRALRLLPQNVRPEKLYGCEVWRGLDWLRDSAKVALDCSLKENLQTTLIGVFDSQISGGKRYDLATMGRRVANATYYASHGVDDAEGLTYAMDLTPLIYDVDLDIKLYVQTFIHQFSQDVDDLISSVE